MTATHPRITIEPDKQDGKPRIRGMRITVNDVLGWLSHAWELAAAPAEWMPWNDRQTLERAGV